MYIVVSDIMQLHHGLQPSVNITFICTWKPNVSNNLHYCNFTLLGGLESDPQYLQDVHVM